MGFGSTSAARSAISSILCCSVSYALRTPHFWGVESNCGWCSFRGWFLSPAKHKNKSGSPHSAGWQFEGTLYGVQWTDGVSQERWILFPSPDGSRYSLATMDTTFRDILFRAGILYRGKGKGPRLHDLRHTFCVHSLQKLTAHGEDPYAVLPLLMTYMGHRTVQATSQYIHLSAESFPAILKQSEALFGNLIPLEDNSNETSIWFRYLYFQLPYKTLGRHKKS